MKTHPISLESKKCGIDYCEFKGDKNSLIRHQENIHGKIVTGQKKCSRCDYSTNTADKFNKHKIRCLKSDKLFKCNSCEYKNIHQYSPSLLQLDPRLNQNVEFHSLPLRERAKLLLRFLRNVASNFHDEHHKKWQNLGYWPNVLSTLNV